MENIPSQIERHQAGIKRIRRAIPLVAIVTLMAGYSGFRFADSAREQRNSWFILGAIVLYCSSFVIAYFTHIRKIKKLQQQL